MPKKQPGVLDSSPCLNSLASVFSSVERGLGRLRGVLSRHIAGGSAGHESRGLLPLRAPGQPKGTTKTALLRSPKPRGKSFACGGPWVGVPAPRPPNPVPKETAGRAEGGSFKKENHVPIMQIQAHGRETEAGKRERRKRLPGDAHLTPSRPSPPAFLPPRGSGPHCGSGTMRPPYSITLVNSASSPDPGPEGL